MNDREATAERLLQSSLDHSYEPALDIDWDAPLVEDAWGIPQHRSSLYGTALWDGLTEEQRRTLTVHEVCSIARMGLWFEIILMQMLLRYAYDRDPRRAHIQYALTEIADECRHSIMFAKMTERYGVPDYAPRPLTHELGRLFKTVGYGPAMFAGTLFVEEILDQLQRESMRDESVQPLTRMVNRIHVTEEARHVRYAREELLRIMPRTNRRSGRSRAGSRRASRSWWPATSSTPRSTAASGSTRRSAAGPRLPTRTGRRRCAGRPASWCPSCASRVSSVGRRRSSGGGRT